MKGTASVRISIGLFSGLPSCCQLCYPACLSGCCSQRTQYVLCCSNVIRIGWRARNSDVPSEWLQCLSRNQTKPWTLSFETGTVEAMARATRSFKAWCQAGLPGAVLGC